VSLGVLMERELLKKPHEREVGISSKRPRELLQLTNPSGE